MDLTDTQLQLIVSALDDALASVDLELASPSIEEASDLYAGHMRRLSAEKDQLEALCSLLRDLPRVRVVERADAAKARTGAYPRTVPAPHTLA